MSEPREQSDDESAARANRDDVGRVLGRGSIYTIATVIQLGAGILTIPILTRIVDPEQYGTITAALVVQAVLGTVAAFGLPAAISRTFWRGHGPAGARALITATALAATALALLAELTGPLWSQIFAGLDYGAELRLAVLSSIPVAVGISAQTYLQASDRAGVVVAYAATATLGAQGLGLALAAADGGPVAYLAGVTAGLYAALAIAWIASGVELGPLARRGAGGRALVRNALRVGLPTIPHGLALYLLSAGDRVVVERLEGLAAAGAYYIAYAVGSLAIFLVAALNGAWGPILYGSERERRWRLLADSAVAVTRVVALAAGALALGAPIALKLFAPADYDLDGLGAVSALVAASALFYLWYITSYNVIIWRGVTGILALSTPVAAVANLALCAVLIPPLGVEGAALATLISYALLALLTWTRARSLAAIPWDPAALALAALPAPVAVAAALLLPEDGAWFEIRALLAAALALAALAALTASRRAAPEPAT